MKRDAIPSSRPPRTSGEGEFVATAVFVIAASLIALAFAITVSPFTA